jgi:UDP-glucose 4-epimerase
MQTLVTGGAGFIGSHLVNFLLDAGHDVRVLDDLSSGARENVRPEAELVEADVSNPEAVLAAMSGVEVAFHEAAHRAVLRSVEHPLETDSANVHGTLAVLQAARVSGTRRVVYASSSSVYGGSPQLPTPETAATLPRSPYAVSKLAGEHYCRVFAELYGLETVSLRYFNVYGPRQRPDSAYAAVIPLFIEALFSGSPPVVHGDGKQSRDFCYIDDVVAANIKAATAPAESCSGKAYNVAGGDRRSLLEILEVLSRLMNAAIEPVFDSPRPGDVRHTEADISAAGRDLGYEPSVTVEEGLDRTVQWLTARLESTAPR